MMNKHILFLLLLLPLAVIGQAPLMPFNSELQFAIDRYLLDDGNSINGSFKPYDPSDYQAIRKSVFNYTKRDSLFLSRKSHPLWWRKLRKESLVQIDSNHYTLEINPYFDFSIASVNEEENPQNFVNGRGIILNGTVGDNFSFTTTFVENQALFPNYLKEYIQKYKIVPGQGKARKFKDNAADYAYASGYFDYRASKHFALRFGQGKNFIGDGYRSLLLSDAAYSYPYLMLSSKLWKFQYINLYSAYLNINTDVPFKTKYSTSHYLIYRPIKSMSIGLFESVVWQGNDSTNRGFDVHYLNPIIFYHPVQFNLGSPDNSLLGLNFDWKFIRKNLFYAQFVLDDFNVSRLKDNGFFQEKYGIQLGLRGADLFRLKNLSYLIEYNQVQPYVYAHKDIRQNYSHYNQPLAHPLGANFRETILLLHYKRNDFSIKYKLNFALYGADTNNTHWGQNIFKSDFDAQRENNEFSVGNHIAQGVKTTLWQHEASISYLINPVTNMKFELGVQQRQVHSTLESKKNLTTVFFSFKTDLFNRYNDF